MKHKTRILIIVFLIGFLTPSEGQELIKDYEGNIYKTVKIGTQVWMAENLKVMHYRNGEPIINIKEASQWKNLNTGAYCHIKNKPDNTKVSGLLYNWYTADDERNICPTGWHVPSDPEWDVLTTFLSGEKGRGGVLPSSDGPESKSFPGASGRFPRLSWRVLGHWLWRRRMVVGYCQYCGDCILQRSELQHRQQESIGRAKELWLSYPVYKRLILHENILIICILPVVASWFVFYGYYKEGILLNQQMNILTINIIILLAVN